MKSSRAKMQHLKLTVLETPHLILRTKLTPPACKDTLVKRQIFIHRLKQDLGQRVTLISASAGFGKSTLAAQWLAETSAPSAWLSLEARDSDLERFMRYLVAALRTAVSCSLGWLENLLSAIQLPPPEYLADSLITELGSLDEPILLVLEDFHTITSPEVQTLLIRVLQHLPPGFRIMVLTRIDPPWPLGLWRARNALTEIRATDLRLSLEESHAFFSDREGEKLSDETVRLLHGKTEGWATGLQLMKMALAGVPDPKCSSPSSKNGECTASFRATNGMQPVGAMQELQHVTASGFLEFPSGRRLEHRVHTYYEL